MNYNVGCSYQMRNKFQIGICRPIWLKKSSRLKRCSRKAVAMRPTVDSFYRYIKDSHQSTRQAFICTLFHWLCFAPFQTFRRMCFRLNWAQEQQQQHHHHSPATNHAVLKVSFGEFLFLISLLLSIGVMILWDAIHDLFFLFWFSVEDGFDGMRQYQRQVQIYLTSFYSRICCHCFLSGLMTMCLPKNGRLSIISTGRCKRCNWRQTEKEPHKPCQSVINKRERRMASTYWFPTLTRWLWVLAREIGDDLGPIYLKRKKEKTSNSSPFCSHRVSLLNKLMTCLASIASTQESSSTF